MGIKNTRFRQGFARRVWEIKGFGFRKCPWDFLEFFLCFKRLGFSPICFNSCLKSIQWIGFFYRGSGMANRLCYTVLFTM